MTHGAKNLQFRNVFMTKLLHEFGLPTLHLETVEPERQTRRSIVVFFFTKISTVHLTVNCSSSKRGDFATLFSLLAVLDFVSVRVESFRVFRS